VRATTIYLTKMNGFIRSFTRFICMTGLLAIWSTSAVAQGPASEGAPVAYFVDESQTGTWNTAQPQPSPFAIYGQPGYSVSPPTATCPTPDGSQLNLDAPPWGSSCWGWHVLPDTLIFPSYWGGEKESRFGGVHFFDETGTLIQEGVLGANFSLLRYGTGDGQRPEGIEWNVEGAAFPRLLPAVEYDLAAVDYRMGTHLSYGNGPWQFKFGYYHISSHIGDEYLLKNPTFNRLNFKRETIIWGIANRPNDWIRLYAEAGLAVETDGGAKPWEFQFGVEFGTIEPTGVHGAPFAAVHGHLRQEVDFGGDFVAQVGWMWRNRPYGHIFRAGFQYLNGNNPQFEFYPLHEIEYGLGLWYDF